MEEFDATLKRWKHRKLSLLGKITVIKTFALPKLIYPFSTLQHPPKETIQLLTKDMYDFLWVSKPDKISRQTIKQDLSNGGLKMIGLNLFTNALKCSWIKRIMDDQNF